MPHKPRYGNALWRAMAPGTPRSARKAFRLRSGGPRPGEPCAAGCGDGAGVLAAGGGNAACAGRVRCRQHDPYSEPDDRPLRGEVPPCRRPRRPRLEAEPFARAGLSGTGLRPPERRGAPLRGRDAAPSPQSWPRPAGASLARTGFGNPSKNRRPASASAHRLPVRAACRALRTTPRPGFRLHPPAACPCRTCPPCPTLLG